MFRGDTGDVAQRVDSPASVVPAVATIAMICSPLACACAIFAFRSDTSIRANSSVFTSVTER